MSTTNKRKKSVTAAVGGAVTVAAPAMLFLGAGTAQADVNVTTAPDPAGVTVFVHSSHPNPPSGLCTYSARAQGNPIGKPLPAVNVPFFLPSGGTSPPLWFPSFQTASTWDITVDCPVGGVQYAYATY